MGKPCRHCWDREKGTRMRGVRALGIRPGWTRKCLDCGQVQTFHDGRYGTFGWFDTLGRGTTAQHEERER